MASSIQEMFDKFKPVLEDDGFFYGVLLVLIAVCSFGLGRLSVMETAAKIDENSPITLEQRVLESADFATSSQLVEGEGVMGTYVASKSGTKYHLPWCPGAKQIKESNMISFATKEEAKAAGYAPAANCKGI